MTPSLSFFIQKSPTFVRKITDIVTADTKSGCQLNNWFQARNIIFFIEVLDELQLFIDKKMIFTLTDNLTFNPNLFLNFS
jgi:hypothetical protein